MHGLKWAIHHAIRRVGFDVRRVSVSSDPSRRLVKSMQSFGIDVVLDVGANRGQFASALRRAGYRGEIVSFEPLRGAHSALIEAALGDPQWHVHERCAIGHTAGEMTLNVSGNSVSSSLRAMLPAHASAAPTSAYVATEDVSVATLDVASKPYVVGKRRTFIKVDTQGYEWEVLEGAQQTLSTAVGVACELSLVMLYEGQRLWTDIVRRLGNAGFDVWTIDPGFTDTRDGRTLQVDATFFRSAALGDMARSPEGER